MVGYKSISELDIKECYDALQHEQTATIQQELAQKYQELMQVWIERDNCTFQKCRTIEEYDNYIKHFDVYFYPIQHKNAALEAIASIQEEQENIQNAEQKPTQGCENENSPKELSNNAFADSLKWGCLWAIIAPILYFIVIIILNS